MTTMQTTNIDGAILTASSLETIRRFQTGETANHIETLEQMIEFLLYEDTITELDNPKVRLDYIRDLRYLEQLLLTFELPADER